jgi:HD-GYP domain-containing protein (c-di-GMP phosphodiesterase class II)
MAVSVEMQHTGDRASQREVAAVIEHVLADRPGDWRVSIVGSQANDRWEMKIVGPNGFERSYTLEGSAGEYEPHVIAKLVARMVLGRKDWVNTKIEEWGEALEAKDPGTWSHCKRVAEFATVLARALKLDEEEVRAIACGALAHEIGKLEIPKAILRKPSVLTAEERLIMRGYCMYGYEIVRKEASVADAAEIVRSHRERFDGTGYPRGLKGEAIPIEARIVAVADTFEMMVRDRPHRGARAYAAARAEIQHWSGRQFDPGIVEVLLNVPDEDWTRACS